MPRLDAGILTLEWGERNCLLVVGADGRIGRDDQWEVVKELGRLMAERGVDPITHVLGERYLTDGSGRSAVAWQTIWVDDSPEVLVEIVSLALGIGGGELEK